MTPAGGTVRQALAAVELKLFRRTVDAPDEDDVGRIAAKALVRLWDMNHRRVHREGERPPGPPVLEWLQPAGDALAEVGSAIRALALGAQASALADATGRVRAREGPRVGHRSTRFRTGSVISALVGPIAAHLPDRDRNAAVATGGLDTANAGGAETDTRRAANIVVGGRLAVVTGLPNAVDDRQTPVAAGLRSATDAGLAQACAARRASVVVGR